jgi:type IV pilus assembly protein PilX
MNPPPIFHCPCARHQRGIVLVVALILLLVVSLSGLAVMRGTMMQNKMSSNFYDREIAFQTAQAALREGEAAVLDAQSGGAGTFRDCSKATTLCPPNPFSDKNISVTTVPGDSFKPDALAVGQPQYVVEYLGNFKSGSAGYANPGNVTADYYRITARSGDPVSVAEHATVTLQSIFYRR